MPIYKPSELIAFLQSLGISPKKGLSQNFLLDKNIIDKTVAAADVHPEDIVLEIGPGPGCVTEALLKRQARVLAVETDTILADALHRFQTPDHHLEVFCEDILKFPLEKHLNPSKKAKVIANLPYHITTPILTKLISLHGLFSQIVVFVQDEVAKRFTAKPGTKNYSSITVFLNFYTNPTYAFKVSRNCFFPKPNVDSAVVVFDLKAAPNIDNVDAFFKLTRTSFEHRRKMLRASLKDLYTSEKVTEALEQLHINPLARPEELSLEDFIALYTHLNR